MTLTAFMLTLVPFAMAFSTNIPTIVFLRFTLGLCIGFSYIVVTAYTAELSPKNLRGALNSLHEVGLTVGQLIAYISAKRMLGMDNDWRWMVGAGLVLPGMSLSCILLLGAPESPRWLIMQKRNEEADRVLVRYLGKREAQEVWESTLRNEREDQSEESPGWGEVMSAFSAPATKLMMISCVVVGLGEPMSGANGLLAYSSKIFEQSMSEEEAFSNTIIMGVAKTLAAFIAMGIVESVGRRPLLLLSCFGCMACNLALASSFRFMWNPQSQVVAICLFFAFFEGGICPMSFTYCAEIVCNKYRAKALSLVFCLARLVGFANLIYVPPLLETNTAGLFYLQGVIGIVSFMGLALIVPESRGKSLEDMHEIFEAKK